jgi:hypothetical protein
MKLYIIILTFFLLQNCSKPKTVLICGDHICVNKVEAEQYFEENLSIEVQIINRNKDKNNNIDLVELNLAVENNNQKQVSITQKNETREKIKVLTNDEIESIKRNIKNKKKVKQNNVITQKKSVKKSEEFNKENIEEISKNKNKIKNKIANKISRKNVNKDNKKIVDVCKIIEKCNIDQISKFIVEEGKKNKYPDITIRE